MTNFIFHFRCTEVQYTELRSLRSNKNASAVYVNTASREQQSQAQLIMISVIVSEKVKLTLNLNRIFRYSCALDEGLYQQVRVNQSE